MTLQTTTNPESSVAHAEANGHNGVNGAGSALPTRRPPTKRWSRRTKLWSAGGALAALVLIIVAYVTARPSRVNRADLVTHRVGYERLELTVVERGTLESARNKDIYCQVKARAQGSTVASSIKWVIDDGSQVKAGDTLVDLDDSGLQEQLKNEKTTMDKAEGDKTQAEEEYKVQVSQNESDIKTAEVNLELAQIDLEKYKEGDYPQQCKIFDGNIKQAESDLEQQRDRVAWANRMVKKGYLTVTQSQGEQSKLESLEISLAKALEDKRVLTDPRFGTGKRQMTALQNGVAEAKRALERVKAQAAAREIKFRSDRDTKKSIYLQEKARYQDIIDEIAKCKIKSPQDGLVVYYVPEQVRGGGGGQQSIVAQGESVREGQKLMQIPDLRKMVVNTKVHEALVARVHTGQPALIRVDSFPDRLLKGHIDYVANVSQQQDFWAPDVKVYTTKVTIDEHVKGLKPGMSAGVTIIVADALEHVLAIPVQSIVGSAELGKMRKCFVMTPDGPEERNIVVGQANAKMAEVKPFEEKDGVKVGLKEGEEVVLNPGALIGDKAKTRQPGQAKDPNEPPAPEGREPKKADKQPAAKSGSPSGDWSSKTPEEREKAQREMTEKFRQASPEQRKAMLEQMPEDRREKVRDRLKAQGIEIK